MAYYENSTEIPFYLKGNHWDDVISQYKEMELQRQSATPDVLAIIHNVQDIIVKSQENATTKLPVVFLQPHVIDLAKNGHIGTVLP